MQHTTQSSTGTADIVERLRSSEPLPACPFDRISPHYLTMPDDKPCPICGQENTTEGPDKCRGADTRIMGEAATEIERLRSLIPAQGSPDCDRLLLMQVQHVLKNLDVERPGCGYGKLATACGALAFPSTSCGGAK